MVVLSGRALFQQLRAERDVAPVASGAPAPAVEASASVTPSSLPALGAAGGADDSSARTVAAASGHDATRTAPEEVADMLERALTARVVPTCTGSLRVVEDSQGAWAGGNGATIWDCALLLAGFLQLQGGLAGARALELGAGTGLVGMCLAKLGARVVLTERALALPLLRRNLQENGLSDAASAAELTWGASPLPAPVAAETPFDVVVGSDLVFPNNAECHGALLQTLGDVMGPSTRCWLGYEPREKDGRPARHTARNQTCPESGPQGRCCHICAA